MGNDFIIKKLDFVKCGNSSSGGVAIEHESSGQMCTFQVIRGGYRVLWFSHPNVWDRTTELTERIRYINTCLLMLTRLLYPILWEGVLDEDMITIMVEGAKEFIKENNITYKYK